MNDYVTHQERMIFREAFIFYTSYCNPPSNQSDDAVEWQPGRSEPSTPNGRNTR